MYVRMAIITCKVVKDASLVTATLSVHSIRHAIFSPGNVSADQELQGEKRIHIKKITDLF